MNCYAMYTAFSQTRSNQCTIHVFRLSLFCDTLSIPYSDDYRSSTEAYVGRGCPDSKVLFLPSLFSVFKSSDASLSHRLHCHLPCTTYILSMQAARGYFNFTIRFGLRPGPANQASRQTPIIHSHSSSQKP